MKNFRQYPFLLLLIFFTGPCDKEAVDPYANIVLEGELQKGMSVDRLPTVSGYIKNIGDGTGYRGRIVISGIKSWNNTIVTAVDISLNGGNPIPRGARIMFESVLPNIKTHTEYDYLTSEIKWERNK